MSALANDLENLRYAPLFNGSSQLQMNWLTHDLIVHDFMPEGRFFVTIYHSHPYSELLVIAAGRGRLELEGEDAVEIGAGSLIYINQGILHKIVSSADCPLQTYLTSFSLEPRPIVEKITQEWAEDERRVIEVMEKNRFKVVQDDGTCLHEISHIMESIPTRKLGELVIIKNHMSSLVMSAFQQFTRLPIREDFESALHAVPTLSASRILSYIQDHFTENISVTSVAEALHYSQRQCQRVIRNNLGISFTDLLTDFRLSYGKKLLCETDYSIEQIAELTGFKSGKSFSRMLRERDGITPYRYRKESGRPAPKPKLGSNAEPGETTVEEPAPQKY